MATIGIAPRVLAASQCVAPPRQTYLPNLLLISCAARQNFKVFRQYSDYVGLAGVVSMTTAQGDHGTYRAGTLILYPWLKPKGQAIRNLALKAAVPTSLSASSAGKLIPGATLPQDEYLCRVVLRAPWQSFIGFMVDTPLSADQARLGWGSNLSGLAGGQSVGVDWTSANLNRAWFGGSAVIPGGNDCDGAAWRALIASALSQVSTDAC